MAPPSGAQRGWVLIALVVGVAAFLVLLAIGRTTAAAALGAAGAALAVALYLPWRSTRHQRGSRLP